MNGKPKGLPIDRQSIPRVAFRRRRNSSHNKLGNDAAMCPGKLAPQNPQRHENVKDERAPLSPSPASARNHFSP
jgi:hypothetical protein